ncbi:MAG: hypothetical protein HUJ27_02535 [Rhodobacteraceae bacterium]|nr:hypothetical protein [Paracoccaceae bacterium]
MKLTAVLSAVFLAASTVMASAACTGDHQQAASCADGTTWDPEAKACVDTSA